MEKRFMSNPEYELATKWNIIKHNFMQEYSCLTPKDLEYAKVGFDKMLHHIGNKMGVSESKLRKIIAHWDDSWLHFF